MTSEQDAGNYTCGLRAGSLERQASLRHSPRIIHFVSHQSLSHTLWPGSDLTTHSVGPIAGTACLSMNCAWSICPLNPGECGWKQQIQGEWGAQWGKGSWSSMVLSFHTGVLWVIPNSHLQDLFKEGHVATPNASHSASFVPIQSAFLNFILNIHGYPYSSPRTSCLVLPDHQQQAGSLAACKSAWCVGYCCYTAGLFQILEKNLLVTLSDFLGWWVPMTSTGQPLENQSLTEPVFFLLGVSGRRNFLSHIIQQDPGKDT